MDNNAWHALSVIQAAHAGELLIKARIAQEHPLLIFDGIPKAAEDSTELLSFGDLAVEGRTVQFKDLPDRLWAATGIRLPDRKLFLEFGRLRNLIQHFAEPDEDVAQRAIDFIFGIIDPFIHQCWGLYAIDYNEDHEPYIYLVNGLIRRGVYFLVSPGAKEHEDYYDFDWPEDNTDYQLEMEDRFKKAKKKKKKY